MEKQPSISEFFSGKTIFITGGTGYVGQCLIEIILKKLPDVKKVYLLVRPRKGRSSDERIKELTENKYFDTVRDRNPKQFEKLIPIEGDVSKLNLGMSVKDRTQLIEEVNIIYNSSASVRFDDSLNKAVLTNTRGTRDLVQMASEMKNLICFMHVSTTYCYTEREIVDEKVYPAQMDWREAIKMSEEMDGHTLEILTQKVIGFLPNTYAFSKSLSEQVVSELCDNKLPAIILRPSVVTPAIEDPQPGWIDNFNGPIGLCVAIGKGILRSLYADGSLIQDYIAVDVVVKGMIIATWKKGTMDLEERNKLDVYNASTGNMVKLTLTKLMEDFGELVQWDVPLDYPLWIPYCTTMTKCWYYFFINVLILHLLPALIIDGISKIAGYKPRLLKVHRRIYIANMAMMYYMFNVWKFINTKFYDLSKNLPKHDIEHFSYKDEDFASYEYIRVALFSAKLYLLKEENLEQSKVYYFRFWVATRIIKYTFFVVVIWLLFFRLNIHSYIYNKLINLNL